MRENTNIIHNSSIPSVNTVHNVQNSLKKPSKERMKIKTTAAVVLFSRRPTMNEINQLKRVHQPAFPTRGVGEFEYFTSSLCAHPVSNTSVSCMNPINVASRITQTHISTNHTKNLRYVNAPLLIDTGDLFTDLISKQIVDQLQIEYRRSNSSLAQRFWDRW
jgi:hypothetical protein